MRFKLGSSENNLTHMSLFTGIGGVDLAAEWAGFKTVGQCEYADYPTEILKKHWPDVPKWRDVRDVTAKSFRDRTGIGKGRLTLLSGGFPCQPHSTVGKRLASADERDLWGEFARIICEIMPEWVLGENVRGLLSSENGRFFGRILRDFSEMGYNVGWCSIRASWLGAVHQRERVFIVAHAACKRWRGMEKNKQNRCSGKHLPQCLPKEIPGNFKGGLLGNLERRFADPSGGVVRNDDGISTGLDRIKCLGNAVVPQQIYPILRQIAEIENRETSWN
ncbi:MAG: DNA (cytosine-5-)-methyltransferase [Oscillospiraceae bacterium]|jgi:DNA (cytosine-5)-methyltransferase 1|nr:DNA (cytosine-5-)-methyltransferase [Oscillospiraceae bacterium]